MPEDVTFQTKPQIAVGLVDRALANGIRVSAWTFDELYGRNGPFLDALEERGQAFVCEVPGNFHGWVKKPKVLTTGPKHRGKGHPRTYPRLAAGQHSREVRNLLTYSRVFQQKAWQRYLVKESDKGPVVWEVKWSVFWRKDESGFPTRRHTLLVARNVLTGEVKYFIASRVPGEVNPVTGERVTVRWLLRVAFGRWSIENVFREGKEELGLDHWEVRGWRCVHRHFFVTALSHLFCARMRSEFNVSPDTSVRVTLEGVRSAINVWLDTQDLCPRCRRQRLADEAAHQQYHATRNEQARQSHHKTRVSTLTSRGIDVTRIKSCLDPRPPT